MSREPTGSTAGNSEAIRIYGAMEEERKQKLDERSEASKPKKVTLPRLKFLETISFSTASVTSSPILSLC